MLMLVKVVCKLVSKVSKMFSSSSNKHVEVLCICMVVCCRMNFLLIQLAKVEFLRVLQLEVVICSKWALNLFLLVKLVVVVLEFQLWYPVK